MRPREIFLKALQGQPVPRPSTGTATSIVTRDLMERVGVSFPRAHLESGAMAELAAAGHEVLGFDNVMPLFSVWHESAALGCPVDWGGAERMPDCSQAIARVGERVPVPADLLTRPPCRVPLQAIDRLRRRFGAEVAVVGKVFGPWTLGYHLCGVEEFLMATLLDPDGVRRSLDALKEVTVAFGRAQVEAGADALCLADHATRDLCSPAAYRDFLLPIHRELRERLPCPVVLHICGDTQDRIPFIRQTGLACFHFDSRVPTPRARELAGAGLALMGGTSNLEVIRRGDLEVVRRDVAEKVRHGIQVIGPECAVPLDAPWTAMAELAAAVKGL
ncbi:MAG: uroporphyrinogen decarboxylase family protein [Candidatus Latescibacterota bacterium]